MRLYVPGPSERPGPALGTGPTKSSRNRAMSIFPCDRGCTLHLLPSAMVAMKSHTGGFTPLYFHARLFFRLWSMVFGIQSVRSSVKPVAKNSSGP